MTWQLSREHLASRYVTPRSQTFYAAALHEARRREYRATLLASLRTRNLVERQILQDAAATLHALTYGTPTPDTKTQEHTTDDPRSEQ